MRRRDFIAGLGAGVLWPIFALADPPVLVPLVGFLNSQSASDYQRQLAAFRDALAEAGYVDGQNVNIEYRWADNHTDRLPAMMAELVNKKASVIAATSTPAALAAKAAGTKIPIVFETAFDPIELGLVTNVNKPGENITGVTLLNSLVTPKRLELLHELVPAAKSIALLVNPANPVAAGAEAKQLQAVVNSLGLHLLVVNASNALQNAFWHQASAA